MRRVALLVQDAIALLDAEQGRGASTEKVDHVRILLQEALGELVRMGAICQ